MITQPIARSQRHSSALAQRSVEIQTYEGAGHAFENPANKSGYRPVAAADAWLRTFTRGRHQVKVVAGRNHTEGITCGLISTKFGFKPGKSLGAANKQISRLRRPWV